MTEKVKFSSIHGQNITLTNSSTTATWSAKHSGGWAFSVSPLEQGQTVVVQLDGSGHCDLGFIKENPNSIDMTKQTPPFKQMNEIRIHKRTCKIPVTLNDTGKEVMSKFQDKTFAKTLDQETTLWLTIYIKFGNISAKVLSNGSPGNLVMFSDNHGANIILGENNFLATTVSANPASTCFVKDKISVGEELVFQCSPLLEGAREPSRFHVKLQVYERNPDSLKKDFKFLFDSGKTVVNDPPVTTLELLEKDDCRGQIVVSLTNGTTVGYRAATTKYNEQRLRMKATEGIWVILELYRTSVTASKRENPRPRKNSNVPDSLVREPSNVAAENSIDPFISWQERTELKQQVSDYSEVSDARLPDDDIKLRLATLEQEQQQIKESVEMISHTLRSPAGLAAESLPVSVSLDRMRLDRPINVRPHFTQLVKDIHCVPLCDKLYEREIITHHEYQEITSELNAPDKNRKMLLTIMKKNMMKSTMDRILDETEQGYLKNMF